MITGAVLEFCLFMPPTETGERKEVLLVHNVNLINEYLIKRLEKLMWTNIIFMFIVASKIFNTYPQEKCLFLACKKKSNLNTY